MLQLLDVKHYILYDFSVYAWLPPTKVLVVDLLGNDVLQWKSVCLPYQ